MKPLAPKPTNCIETLAFSSLANVSGLGSLAGLRSMVEIRRAVSDRDLFLEKNNHRLSVNIMKIVNGYKFYEL